MSIRRVLSASPPMKLRCFGESGRKARVRVLLAVWFFIGCVMREE
jgi:hypothetical protein